LDFDNIERCCDTSSDHVLVETEHGPLLICSKCHVNMPDDSLIMQEVQEFDEVVTQMREGLADGVFDRLQAIMSTSPELVEFFKRRPRRLGL
jgi:hypothetical protein